VTISIKQLFAHQTIAALSAAIASSAEVMQPAPQGAVSGRLDLLPIQQQFLEAGGVDLHHFNQAVLLSTPGDFDGSSVVAIVKALYERHDALRLRFEQTSLGEWQAQHVSLTDEMVSASCVLETLPEGDREQSAFISARCQHWQESLDIRTGPLLRVVYFRPATHQKHSSGRLFIVLHHLVVDGVSWRILLPDLELAYQQYTDGQAIELGDKTYALQRWGQALMAYADSAALADEAPYWLRQHSADITPLPVDKALTSAPLLGSTQVVQLQLSEAETQALLQQCGQAYRTQINELLLAGVYLGMLAWTGETRVRVSLEGHGREDGLLELNSSETVGWFTSMYPLELLLDR